jgi:hypothetical protein
MSYPMRKHSDSGQGVSARKARGGAADANDVSTGRARRKDKKVVKGKGRGEEGEGGRGSKMKDRDGGRCVKDTRGK